jgi:sensor domain CHASE-containing protein
LKKTKDLIESNPFLLTINYISSDRRIRFVSPFEQNKIVIGLKIEIAAPKEALEQAKSSLRPYLSRPFEIIQGKLGYSLMIPYDSDEFFELVFKAESVFGNNSRFRLFKDVEMNISDEKFSVFHSPEFDNLSLKFFNLKVEEKGTLLNRTLQFKAVPTKELLEKTAYFWQLIATGSIFLCFVLLVIVILLQALSIKERKKSEETKERLIKELQDAIAEIRTLRDILPLCSFCKKIRDDK